MAGRMSGAAYRPVRYISKGYPLDCLKEEDQREPTNSWLGLEKGSLKQ